MKKGRVCGSEDQWFHHKKHYGVVRGMWNNISRTDQSGAVVIYVLVYEESGWDQHFSEAS